MIPPRDVVVKPLVRGANLVPPNGRAAPPDGTGPAGRSGARTAKGGPVAKREFHIGAVLRRVRRAVAGLPKAALFELAEAGHRTVFEQVASGNILTRTREEVTLEAVLRLFRAARAPAPAARLGARG